MHASLSQMPSVTSPAMVCGGPEREHGGSDGKLYATLAYSPVILWEKRGLPETNCNKRYFYRILIRIFL